MARSTLGLIALIVLVALVVYFVMEERDDDLEIDIGLRAVPVNVLPSSVA
ncbi:MAG: hypothetical protein AB7T31_10630 [Gemmatimonadales bacterium]